MKTVRTIFSFLTVTFLFVAQSSALLISGQDIIDAPISIIDDIPGAANFHQQAFNERQDVLLSTDLLVDGDTISAGTAVDSHMIFLNTPNNNRTEDFGVEWLFDGEILGVMSDRGGNLEFASNSVLGALGTNYPGNFNLRGMESNDSYFFSGNSIIVNMQVREPGDWIRVITQSSSPAPVPEPATVFLLGTGLIGLAGLGRKRIRK